MDVINGIRFAHILTRAPITQLDVPKDTTMGTLRVLVEANMASEERCLMRVFSKWFVGVRIGGSERLIEITNGDEMITVTSMGIDDYSTIYLEGPMIDDLDSVAQAVAIVNAEHRQTVARHTLLLEKLAQTAEQQAALLQSIKVGQQEQTALLNHLTLAMSLVTHKNLLDLEVSARASIVAEEVSNFDVVKSKFLRKMDHSKEVLRDKAWSILQKCGNRPITAFWKSLKDPKVKVHVLLAILEDNLEIRSEGCDGQFVATDMMNIPFGATPLILAAYTSRQDVVEALVAVGADINAQDVQKSTALHVAVRYNNLSIIKFLILSGARVDVPNDAAATPLHVAAIFGHTEVIVVLVESGANKDLKAIDGKTPLETFEGGGISRCDNKKNINKVRELLKFEPTQCEQQ